MGAIDQKALNREQNIWIAISFTDDSERTTIVNANLWQLLRCRRKVASLLVRWRELEPDTLYELKNLFDKYQHDIKQLLGLMDEPEKTE